MDVCGCDKRREKSQRVADHGTLEAARCAEMAVRCVEKIRSLRGGSGHILTVVSITIRKCAKFGFWVLG